MQLKVEQEQLEQQMYDLLSLPNPTEVQNEYYAQLKASHTGVLARQTALHHTLLDLAEQVRQGREVRQNDMPHLSTLRSGNAAVTQAQLGAELGAGLVASQELRRRREEEEALEWAKADSLRESRAEAKTAGGAASEAAFEQQLLQAAEESLQRPPPHPDHDEVAEALRQSEWTAAEAARAAAAEEARELEELRSAEAASRSEELGVDDDEELRRACADSLTSSRVSRARTWRMREEDEALARAKADSLRESGAVDEAEAEELRRALQLSSVWDCPPEPRPPEDQDFGLNLDTVVGRRVDC